MRRLPTRLDGPILIETDIIGDQRGFFLETYRRQVFADLGISDDFVQDNHSRSRRGVVRGMHFQPGMAKLVRCVRGAIFDVIVDIRQASPQHGQWEGVRLDEATGLTLYVPDGFAHGFCVLSEEADVVYRCSEYYDSAAERGFAYDDPDVGIAWPADLELVASDRDRAAPRLAQLRESARP